MKSVLTNPSRMMDAAIMLSKFRGAMLGTLLGDCCGAPYEGEILESGDRITLRKYFDKLEGPFFKAPIKMYTDDTAMTKSVASCLIADKDIVTKNLAMNFMKEFFNNPKRGYGGAVTEIFVKLRKSKLSDPLGPGREQFNGTGSYGNGAAMRITPVGLFCHNNPDKLIDLAKKSAEITHTHKLGINGAILQAKAINLCVSQNPQDFNLNSFCDELNKTLEIVENDDDELGLDNETPYLKQIAYIRRTLSSDTPASEEEVLNILGHSIAALYSVPTAIYCFLRAQNDIEGIKTDNIFRRTLEYAISLGGDTDTIASMAGALTGALHGETIIAENLIKHCESHEEIIELANSLYQASI